MSQSRGSVSLLICACVFLTVVFAQDLYEGDICKTLRGKQWTCRQIRQCPKAMQLLQSGGRPEVCRYAGIDPVVCCEPNTPSRPQPPPKTPKPPPPSKTPKPVVPRPRPKPTPNAGSKARQMCKEYGKHVFISLGDWDFGGGDQKIDTCNQLDTLIVGGSDARPREFPHMAQVGYGNSEKSIRWKCGGSLISKNFVLSAAHCTEVYGLPAKWVRLGEFNIATKNDEATGEARPEVIQISQRINHPNYRSPISENDIALYKLARDVDFNEFIRPVCLQPDTFIKQTYGTATGWGNTEFAGKNSAVLQKVNVTLITSRECSRHYPSNADTLPKGIQGDSMLCAGDTFSHKDSCQGDSGGPLQVLHPDVYCSYNLVGIVSFGEGCGAKPGVYTRVSHFIPWIEQNVWQ